MNKINKMGYKAFYDGKNEDECPYKSSHDIANSSQKRIDWYNGYFFARIEKRCKRILEKNNQEWKWED